MSIFHKTIGFVENYIPNQNYEWLNWVCEQVKKRVKSERILFVGGYVYAAHVANKLGRKIDVIELNETTLIRQKLFCRVIKAKGAERAYELLFKPRQAAGLACLYPFTGLYVNFLSEFMRAYGFADEAVLKSFHELKIERKREFLFFPSFEEYKK